MSTLPPYTTGRKAAGCSSRAVTSTCVQSRAKSELWCSIQKGTAPQIQSPCLHSLRATPPHFPMHYPSTWCIFLLTQQGTTSPFNIPRTQKLETKTSDKFSPLYFCFYFFCSSALVRSVVRMLPCFLRDIIKYAHRSPAVGVRAHRIPQAGLCCRLL